MIQDNLLPFSRIASAFEQCQTLIQATFDADTRCYANGGCTGLNCDLDVTSVEENDMVFVVDKCRDPVLVNITIYHGGEAIRSVSHNDWIFLGGGEYLAVTMERNATDLHFSVSLIIVAYFVMECDQIALAGLFTSPHTPIIMAHTQSPFLNQTKSQILECAW